MRFSASRPLRCAAVAAAAVVLAFTFGDGAQAATCNTLLNTSTLFIGSGPGCSASGEQKIFLARSIGTTVSGNVGSHTGTPIVDFTSSTSLRAGNGFATVGPLGANAFDDLTISIEPTAASNFTFGALSFRELTSGVPTSLTIEAFDSSGTSLGMLSLNSSELGHAISTRFFVMAPSDPIASLVLESSGFMQVKQFKIADVVDPPVGQVPLPGALPLFGAGLGMLALLGWRRKRKVQTLAA
jgi:hypothetical protein